MGRHCRIYQPEGSEPFHVACDLASAATHVAAHDLLHTTGSLLLAFAETECSVCFVRRRGCLAGFPMSLMHGRWLLVSEREEPAICGFSVLYEEVS